MTVEPIGIIALAIGLIGLFLPPTFIVYAFSLSTLLGAAAALILDSLGGTSVQPAHLLLGFLTIKLLMEKDISNAALNGVAPFRAGFWLTLTVIYGVIMAYVLPRLFFGDTMVFPVRVEGTYVRTRLAPQTSNLTQSVYFIGDLFCFVLLYGFSRVKGARYLAVAMIASVGANLMFAALDLITFQTGTGELLAFIRNSTYSMMSEVEIGGLKRINGSFVEASAFSYWTMGYFGFASSLWLSAVKPRLTGSLAFLSLLALVFSTSTTAYASLGLFLLLRYVAVVVRMSTGPSSRQMASFVVLSPLVALLVVLLVALNDTASSYITDLLDTLVFNKLSTDSGIERSSWNTQALQNLFDTYGFGVGNGSVRTSSFVIAVVASLGIIGTATFAAFMYAIWFGQRAKTVIGNFDTAIVPAARAACLAQLIAASISSSLLDLGLPFFAFAALACASPLRRKVPATEFKSARGRPLRGAVSSVRI